MYYFSNRAKFYALKLNVGNFDIEVNYTNQERQNYLKVVVFSSFLVYIIYFYHSLLHSILKRKNASYFGTVLSSWRPRGVGSAQETLTAPTGEPN